MDYIDFSNPAGEQLLYAGRDSDLFHGTYFWHVAAAYLNPNNQLCARFIYRVKEALGDDIKVSQTYRSVFIEGIEIKIDSWIADRIPITLTRAEFIHMLSKTASSFGHIVDIVSTHLPQPIAEEITPQLQPGSFASAYIKRALRSMRYK